MNAEVTELIREDGHIIGLQAATPEGPLTVRAMLIIGADGRHSIVRAQAGLKGVDFGAPMDVLWFRLSRRPDDPPDPVASFDTRRIFIMLNRGAYWQCGFVIPKGSHAQVKARGLPSLHKSVAGLAPFISDRVGELRDWESIKLLTVQVDRLRQWYRTGVICIGDAAHAMSPVGGVGINLAIQDAVAAANLLAAPLRENRVTDKDLHGVQQRRAWPTKTTQGLQLLLQKRVIGRIVHGKDGNDPVSPPFFIRLLARFPFLGWIPARLIGMGFRPEHVHTTDVWND
jgi:2-polyprenyl-6-methoxyphenol hydroxylase-like FAD-dependent oxidoreductase